jgi:hypothetical protein
MEGRKNSWGIFFLVASVNVLFWLSSVGCEKKSAQTGQTGYPSSTTGQATFPSSTTFTNPDDAATKTFGSLSAGSDNIITARASQSEMITGRMITGRAITARIITGRIITARSPKFLNVSESDNDDESDVLNLFGRLKKSRLSKKQSEGAEISCEDLKPKCVEGKVEKAYCNQSTNRLNFDIKVSDCKEIVDEQKGDYIVSTGYVKGYLEVSTKVSQNISDARFTVAIEDGDSLVKEFIGNKETKRVKAKASNFRTEITGRFIEGEKDVDFRVVTKLSGAYSREDEIGNRKEAYSYNDYVVELTGKSPKSGGEATFHMSIGGGYSVDTEPDSCVEGAFNFKTIKPVKSSGQGYCGIESGEIEVNNARMEFSSGKVKVSVENQQKEYGCEELGGLCKYKPITIAEGVEQKPCPVWFKDKDKDGYTDGTTKVSCTKPSDEYVSSATAGDCNDDDPDMHLGKAEICDNKDNNCDGLIDEGVKLVFYKDLDGDGYTDGTTQVGCIAPTGYVLSATPGDCNDNDPNIRTCPPSSWLAGWGYRRAIRISNYSSSSLTDYQVLISNPVYSDAETQALYQAKARWDCGDIRFTDSDGQTLLSYWIESPIVYSPDEDGFIGNWLILGPFTGTAVGCGYNDLTEPINVNDDFYAGKVDAGNTWFEHHGFTSACEGRWCTNAAFGIDLNCIFGGVANGDPEHVNAYAFVYVFSPTTRTVQLRIGSDDGIRVWLNGQLVWNNYTCRCKEADQDITTVTLNPGWNKLLLRVGEFGGEWGFVVRFTDSNGNPMTDLRYSLTPGCNSKNTRVWVKVPSIPASTTKTIYVYYGNPNTTSQSSVTNTFIRQIDGAKPVKGSWHFDEGSGTTAYDSSGNNYHGTLANGTTWTIGKFGKALNFDGVDDHVQSVDDPFDLSGEISIEAWFKTTATDGAIISKHHCGYGNGYFIQLGEGAPGKVRAYYSGTWLTSPNTYNDGNWHHVVFTKSSTELRLYIDGIRVANSTSVPSYTPNSIPLRIGIKDPSSCDPYGFKYPFLGIIDEVRIYSRQLLPEEILDLYNNYGYTTPNYPGKVLVRKYIFPEPTVSIGAEEVLSGGGSAPYIREQSSLGDVEEKQTRYGCSSANIVFYVLYLIFPAFILFALLKRRFFVRN